MGECIAIELAEWIEAGLACAAASAHQPLQVVETPLVFLYQRGRICHAGALGLAYLGRSGAAAPALEHWTQLSPSSLAGRLDAAAALLGVPVALARLVEVNHRNTLSAREIARHLRAGTLGVTFGAKPARTRTHCKVDRAAEHEFSQSFPLDAARAAAYGGNFANIP